jgi:protein gp37
MGKTKIEWATDVWNPIAGCTRVSPGCEHCYAEKMTNRLVGMAASRADRIAYDRYQNAIKETGRWSGRVSLFPERLEQPLRWRKPRRVFVCSMSDLFHEAVPFELIEAVLGVAVLAPHHTFQILTKRAERMQNFFAVRPPGDTPSASLCVDSLFSLIGPRPVCGADWSWPPKNVWLGVSVEDQQRADERIPLLLETPAAVRFVSAESLLGPVELPRYMGDRYTTVDPSGAQPFLEKMIDWVIVGGESGPSARPCDIRWIESIIGQCHHAKVPCFVKQLGRVPVYNGSAVSEFVSREMRKLGWRDIKHPKGGDPEEWPEDLRVREWPEGKR